MTAKSKHAAKRTPQQRQLDRTHLAELLQTNPGYNDIELGEALASRTGIQLSRQQIQKDRSNLLANHAEREAGSMELYMQQAMDKLDGIAAKAEEGWLRSITPAQQTRSKSLATRRRGKGEKGWAGSELDDKLYLAELETLTTEGVGDPRFLSIMLDVEKERNKLRQLYAPKTSEQTNNFYLVKAIANFDPKKWDKQTQVIDG